MSLRLRLLLAVGAVSLIALVVADVVTYRSLKSFLYDRVDQSLIATRRPIDGPGGFGRRGGGGPPEGFNAPAGTSVQVQTPGGTTSPVTAYKERDGDEFTPNLPNDLAARAPANGSDAFMT